MPKVKFGIAYYSTSEVAKEIGVSKSTLLDHLRKKKLKDIPHNQTLRREWLQADVDRAVKYFRKHYETLQANRLKKKKEA